MEKRTTTKRASSRSGAKANVASFAAGLAGIILAVWLVYGTVTIDPFRWGLFVEELIVAIPPRNLLLRWMKPYFQFILPVLILVILIRGLM